MLAKKAGFFTVFAAVMLMLGGCGSNAGANLGGVRNGYENGAYWDGYGINGGRSLDGYNGGNYTTYGMRDDSLAQDLRNAWDDLSEQGENRTNDRKNRTDDRKKQTEKRTKEKEIGDTNKAMN